MSKEYPFHCKIVKESKSFDERMAYQFSIRKWLNEARIKYQVGNSSTFGELQLTFYFETDVDLMHFKLRWM